MGINASADLIWGVIVKAYDIVGEPRTTTYDAGPEEGTITTWVYSEEAGWNDELLEGTRLEWVQVGHYGDPEPKAILTLKDSKRFSADCWDAQAINPRNDLLWEPAEKQVKKGGDEAISLGLPDLRDGEWYLIAGMG